MAGNVYILVTGCTMYLYPVDTHYPSWYSTEDNDVNCFVMGRTMYPP